MHKPVRMCVSCRERHEKDDLIRLSISNNEIIVDNEKAYNSRAIYVCKNEKCISNLKKNKAISRAFKTNTNDSFYENLKNSI